MRSSFRRAFVLPLAAAALLATAAGTGAAGAAPASGTDATRTTSGYVIDGRQVFPEGVAADRYDVYVTSAADGTVYRGPVGGGTLRPFLTGGRDGRTTAAGVKSTGSRLLVAGGDTGRFYAYGTGDAALVGVWTVPDPDRPTFLNDEVVAPNGDVYVTDSFRPVLYRIPAAEVGGPATGRTRTLQPAVELPDQTEGFNANGVAVTPDGSSLLVAYSNSGALYRVDLVSGKVSRVPLDRPVTHADGIVLRDHTLYVARNFDNLIATVRLSRSYDRGTVTAERGYPGADVPTTLAVSRGRLLVVNSQFDTLFMGTPLTSEVFTVSSLPLD